MTAIIHWDSTNQKQILFGEERHGVTMDCSTHEYLHTTVNTRYRSGLSMTVAASGNPSGFDGSVDPQAEVGVSDGMLMDEDILIDITHNITPTQQWEQILDPIAWMPIYYRDGALGDWRVSKASQFPLLYAASQATSGLGYTRPAWNNPDGPFTLDEATDEYFFSTWIMGTNDLTEPVAVICGQREDPNLEDALNNNTFGSLSFGTFPFAEFKMLYRITWETQTAYGNTPKAVIRDVTDFRSVTSLPTGQPQVQVHGSLSGRDEINQHPADAISTDNTSWTGNLSAGVDDVQDALDVFDQYIPPEGGLSIIPPTTDLTVSGITTTVPVTANDTGFGAALFLESDALFYEADASGISTMPCHVLAAEAGVGPDILVLLFGYIRDDTWAWTPGAGVYVSTTDGELTESQPAVSGDIVQVVGWAYSPTILFFDRDKTTIEVL
jgi:hypothetical protein